ncbi:class I SAM-dependent rRNA methyltransferase [Alloprevotella sp. OH1205_COT-284]|uniref:class I SAM-dependent rRNA methyltransferase n=1 Tax=Alloprevotella sp. OH1205_COT-284 TaxID=2491043 RepID=UPI000F5DFD8A|nr:class I SAM-dependent rRNA methyltransferase [Alloprevotella sp. OH1205_COT-284]RRD80651.1 class I SAM-dependent rRNA methyltransferase [Alloprevotella sp. OH1205_COT-284]
MHTLQLRRGKSESLKRFHPWVFSGALQTTPPIEEGEIVRLIDSEGNFMAIGHYQIGSIAVRVLSFEDEPVDRQFWERRLRQAFSVRTSIGLTTSPDVHEIYRLVHGEGDLLPGLIVDVFGETAVVQAHSVGMHHNREDIAEALLSVSEGKIKNIYYKSETTLPYKANLKQENGFLRGYTDINVAREYGLAFHIDWLHGQKTGFFVDQRENRRLLEQYSHGRSVLNMFCYTGGFSVYALRGGASLVHSVDASSKAIELTRKNVRLNFPDDTRHEAFTEDAFKFLECAGGNYDLIVLDPPAFAKHQSALRNAIKGYTRLNATAFKKIRPGGIVFTFSCSQAVNKDQFRLAVFTAAVQSGRHVRILHQMHQPADHPVSIYHPEGEYLKGLVLQVE